MATSELIDALQALAHERKIDEFYLIERLEASLAKSYQNILDLEWDARVTIDRQTGKIYVYEMVPVGEPDEETGEYTEFEERDVTPNDVSRIAAQNAKNVISSIVRTPNGQVEYDPSGKANGRGAYLCSLACLEKALQTHKLDKALRMKVNEEDNERIAQEVMSAVLD